MKTSLLLVALVLASCRALEPLDTSPTAPPAEKETTMELGAFSISLAVKDLAASRSFYEKLGFAEAGGDASQNWLILRNGTTTIGLFQGMFPNNLMTFNPGWSWEAKGLDEFTDIRDIQARLKEAGLELQAEAEESGTGPAHLMLVDPDGNAILLDQHVDKKG